MGVYLVAKTTDAGILKIMTIDVVIRLSQESSKDLTEEGLLNLQCRLNQICTELEDLKFDVTYKMEVDNREFKGEY